MAEVWAIFSFWNKLNHSMKHPQLWKGTIGVCGSEAKTKFNTAMSVVENAAKAIIDVSGTVAYVLICTGVSPETIASKVITLGN